MYEAAQQKWLGHAISEQAFSTLIVCLLDGQICEVLRIVAIDRFQTQFRCDLREIISSRVFTETLDEYHATLLIRNDKS